MCVCLHVQMCHLSVTVCLWVGTEQTCPAQGTKGRGSNPGLVLGFPGEAGPPCGTTGMGGGEQDTMLMDKKESVGMR